MPRPTKLTPDMQHMIITRLSAGSPIETTCDSVGIHKDTFYQWLLKGEAGKAPYADFADAVARAKADGLIQAAIRFREGMNPSDVEAVTTETSVETRLRKVKMKDGSIVEEPYEYKKTVTRKTVTHAPGDWRAAMEYLARRDPKHWANVQKNEHMGKDGGKIQFEWSQVMQVLTDDDDNFA
jgi:hypothetical protein